MGPGALNRNNQPKCWRKKNIAFLKKNANTSGRNQVHATGCTLPSARYRVHATECTQPGARYRAHATGCVRPVACTRLRPLVLAVF